MKRYALHSILAILVLASSGRLFSDELKILKPNSDKLIAGSTVTIRWEYTFLEWYPQTPEQRKMQIDLVFGQAISPDIAALSLDRHIAQVDVNSCSYSWKVPAGDDYFRKIKINMLQKPSLKAYSTSFKIGPFTFARPPVVAAPVAEIKVYKPIAGFNYPIGSTVTIRWDKGTIENYAHIWLQVCWPDHTSAAGAFATANSGSHPWLINETEENDYCIKVFTSDDKHVGYSGVFHIKKN